MPFGTIPAVAQNKPGTQGVPGLAGRVRPPYVATRVGRQAAAFVFGPRVAARFSTKAFPEGEREPVAGSGGIR